MNIIFYLTLSLYLIAGFLYLLPFIFNQPKLAVFATRITWVSWIFHAGWLAYHFVQSGYPFLTTSTVSYLFTGWIIVLAFLVLNQKYRFQLIGALILPIVALFYLLSLFSSENYRSGSAWMHSPWASVHLIFSFLALAIFTLTFILGMIFIVEEFQLKYKVLPKFFLRLPSLEILEQIHAKALTVGFALLSGGILTGAIWAKSVTGFYFFEDARQLWAIIAWLIYALFLQARFAAGWRGRRGVLLSLIGFVVILFTFLGVQHGS